MVLSTNTVATPTDKKRQVNFLLRRRVCRRDQSISYLARWVGLCSRQDSWVPAVALNPQKVRDYKVWYKLKLNERLERENLLNGHLVKPTGGKLVTASLR